MRILAFGTIGAGACGIEGIGSRLAASQVSPSTITEFATGKLECSKGFLSAPGTFDKARADKALDDIIGFVENKFGVRIDCDAPRIPRMVSFLFDCCEQVERQLSMPLVEIPRARFGIFLGTCSGNFPEAAHLFQLAAKVKDNRSIRIIQGSVSFAGLMLKRYLGWMLDDELTLQVTNTACSSSLDALLRGSLAIESGRIDLAVVAGTDLVTEGTHRGFAASKVLTDDPCRPFDENRVGFQIGEGAGVLLLGRREWGSTIRGIEPVDVESFGVGLDGYHLTAPDPNARGLSKALESAVAAARGQIGAVVAHGTATQRNDPVELAAYERFLDTATPVASVKSTFGHSMGAAGMHNLAASIWSLNQGKIPGTRNLESPIPTSMSLSPKPQDLAETRILTAAAAFGGHNVAVVLSQANN